MSGLANAISFDTYKKRRVHQFLPGWSKDLNNKFGADVSGETYLNQNTRSNAGSLQGAYDLNNAYIGNRDAVFSDLQNVASNGTYADANDFVNQYNNKVNYLNQSWQKQDIHQDQRGWQTHNNYFNELYASRANVPKGDIGVNNKLSDLLGSSTWNRSADWYEQEFDQLDDTGKASRTYEIDLNGQKVKVFKNSDGTIGLFPNEQPVTETPVTETSSTEQPRTPTTETDKDISNPKENPFNYSDWIKHSMNAALGLAANNANYKNNVSQKVYLQQAPWKDFKTTSNYAQRQQLENAANNTLTANAIAASNISNMDTRNNILEHGYKGAQQYTNYIIDEWNKAHNYNLTGTVDAANYNIQNGINNANINGKSLNAVGNNILNARNKYNQTKSAIISDALTKNYDDFSKTLLNHRNNEEYRLSQHLYNRYLEDKHDQYNEYYNATTALKYNPDYIKQGIKNIFEGQASANASIYDTYYAEHLTNDELNQLRNVYLKLDSNQALSTQDQALIDKVLAINTDYNKAQFAGLQTAAADLKKLYTENMFNLGHNYRTDITDRLNYIVSDQWFPLGAVRAKKGTKLKRQDYLANATKIIQKEQEHKRSSEIKEATLRLQKLEKELDRLHAKELLILKQIYK